MHLAVSNADEWLKLNTSYCNRLHAWITPHICDVNREDSGSRFGARRCLGCGGLHDQEQSPAPLIQSFHTAIEEVLGEDPQLEETPPEPSEGKATSHGFGEDEGHLDAELMVLFPELAGLIQGDQLEEEQKEVPRIEERSAGKRKLRKGAPGRKYAVYIGRCRKCGGYMVNGVEWHDDIKDDEIYRCFNCGWRTSPEYEWNRSK